MDRVAFILQPQNNVIGTINLERAYKMGIKMSLCVYRFNGMYKLGSEWYCGALLGIKTEIAAFRGEGEA